MEPVTLSDGTRIVLNGFGAFQIPDLKQCEDTVYITPEIEYSNLSYVPGASTI